jgi:transcription-repair coupling factor (superfamily II helicase)
VARLRRRAAQAGLADVVAMGSNLRIAPANLPDSMRVRLQRLYPKAKLVAGGDAMVVPLPQDADDANLIAWVRQLLDALWPLPVSENAETASA